MGSRLLAWASNGIGLVALIILGSSAYNALTSLGGVAVPSVPVIAPEDRVALNAQQGWPDGWGLGQAQWFHHASQGTRILPLDWFLNLQQPVLDPGAPKIVEGDYLQRFGFLPSTPDDDLNPNTLPIGFAIEREFEAPFASPPSTGPVVGLTCAACHTGQIQYTTRQGRLKSVRIEGGSAMINISAFQKALGLAIGFTAKIPSRFDRFARAVLGLRYNPTTHEELRSQLDGFLDAGLALSEFSERHHLEGTVGGFGRTDALSLIGNRVFVAVGNENLIAPNAPVNFPPIWDTPWFDWVQYNASIRMPLVRNIGEALGVGAPVNLDDRRGELFRSTVNVENLHHMEGMIGGDTTLSGLKPPRWRDVADQGILPELEDSWIREGATLYKDRCQRCHLPPMDVLRAYIAGEPLDDATRAEVAPHFVEDAGGPTRKILKLQVVDLREIGTDPNQAMNFYRRTSAFQGRTISAASGLFAVTEAIRRDKLAELKIPDDPKDPRALEYNRFRAFDPPGDVEEALAGAGMAAVLVANLKYRARPLDGLWATPPFLHNGSVPNLEQLLSPVTRRDRTFYLGSTRFDATKVGFDTGEFHGGFLLDTTLPGNSNAGHEFRNLTLTELETVPELWGCTEGDCPPKGGDEAARWARVMGLAPEDYAALTATQKDAKVSETTRKALEVERVRRDHPFPGVLGAEFTEAERRHLIEYLKSL